jgi:hypothetical protein
MSQPNPPANPSSGAAARLANFAALSAVVTGFQAGVISPTLDPIDLKQLYLDTADAQGGAPRVDQLIAQFLSLAGQPPQTVADALLATANASSATVPPPTALLARSIVKMWYLGAWYPAVPASDPSSGNGNVISSNAYVGGLAWKAAQAHPMGYSQFSFGYWSSVPPSLAAFGVDLPEGGGDNG